MRLLLIHGMSRTPLSLAILMRYFGYAACLEPFDRIVGWLIATVRAHFKQRPYALIGHSLGGILARAALPAIADMPPRHLVMLGPPNQPPLLARRLHAHPLYRLATRDCGAKLADPAFYAALPPIPAVHTLIMNSRQATQAICKLLADTQI